MLIVCADTESCVNAVLLKLNVLDAANVTVSLFPESVQVRLVMLVRRRDCTPAVTRSRSVLPLNANNPPLTENTAESDAASPLNTISLPTSTGVVAESNARTSSDSDATCCDDASFLFRRLAVRERHWSVDCSDESQEEMSMVTIFSVKLRRVSVREARS